MRKISKFIICLLLCIFISVPNIAYSFIKSEDFYLSLDFSNSNELPNNFRSTSDLTKLENSNIDLSGFESLNISGSAQFTSLSLSKIKETIKQSAPKSQIIDIDLRQESHGFINGNAISWIGAKNNINNGLTLDEVIPKENKQLASIPFGKSISLNNGNYNLVPTTIESENTLVKPNNIKYFRITVTDADRPTDEMVDRFISFVNALPEYTWLHFHCKEGIGRTTIFMILYDIMKNSKSVSFEDIMNRQFLLLDVELLKKNFDDSKTTFIKNFYDYAKNNNDNFSSSWSNWVKENNIKPYK